MESGGKKRYEKIIFLFVRYIILILAGIFLSVFYKLFFPLTIWLTYFLLSLFDNVSIFGNLLLTSGGAIEIVDSCIAGSAYFLLLILNLTTPMNIKKRLYSLIFSFLFLLILNVLRIFFLSILYIKNYLFFDVVHSIFWIVLSVLFVIGIWFLTIKLFKIKRIPIYSDIKYIKLLC